MAGEAVEGDVSEHWSWERRSEGMLRFRAAWCGVRVTVRVWDVYCDSIEAELERTNASPVYRICRVLILTSTVAILNGV